MARVPLTRQTDWRLLDRAQDVRGFPVFDPAGAPLGQVVEMIIDTRASLVDAVILDDGAEIPATQFIIDAGRVRVLAQPLPVPGLAETPPGVPQPLPAQGALRDVPPVVAQGDTPTVQGGVDLSVFASPTRLRSLAPSPETPASPPAPAADSWPRPSPARPLEMDEAEVTQLFDAGEQIRVPLVEEHVTVTREPEVVEEVEITKVLRPGVLPVQETVRLEQLDLDERWDVERPERDAGS